MKIWPDSWLSPVLTLGKSHPTHRLTQPPSSMSWFCQLTFSGMSLTCETLWTSGTSGTFHRAAKEPLARAHSQTPCPGDGGVPRQHHLCSPSPQWLPPWCTLPSLCGSAGCLAPSMPTYAKLFTTPTCRSPPSVGNLLAMETSLL